MQRSFLEALGDFLALAALEIVEPKRIKGKVRNSEMYHPIEEGLPSPTMWTVSSVSFAPVQPGAIGRTDLHTWNVTAPETKPTRVEAERVMAQLDTRGRLHSFNDTPAIVFPDGTAKFYWHGVHVPEFVVKEPRLITPQGIDEEPNQEIRRVMVERFGGVQKYIEQCGAKLIKRDDYGELYEKEKAPDVTWEKLRFVKVRNSTAEPDGTFKDYFIRVPPATKTPQEGIAWTFRLDKDSYVPALET